MLPHRSSVTPLQIGHLKFKEPRLFVICIPGQLHTGLLADILAIMKADRGNA